MSKLSLALDKVEFSEFSREICFYVLEAEWNKRAFKGSRVNSFDMLSIMYDF